MQHFILHIFLNGPVRWPWRSELHIY